MDSYDVLMIVVLLGATLFGFWKGMAWQIASIASLTVSYMAALAFSPRLAPFMGNEAPWNRFIAMLVIYLLTSMLIWMAFRAVHNAIDRVQLREFDRQIGALFGIAKGVLLCVAITMFAVTLLPEEQKEKILGSKSGHYIAKLLNEADQVMPEEMHDVLHPYIHKAQETLDPDYVPHGDERSIPHTADLEEYTFSLLTPLKPITSYFQPTQVGTTPGNSSGMALSLFPNIQWIPRSPLTPSGHIRQNSVIRTTEDLRPFLEEWERIWFSEYPEHLEPLEIHAGII